MNIMNEIYLEEKQLISWKGKTLYQVISILKPTQDTNTNTNTQLLMKARPVKRIYRKEIAINKNNEIINNEITGNVKWNNTITTGNPRLSVNIDLMNSPNGFTIYKENEINKNCIKTETVGIIETLIPNKYKQQEEFCNNCNISNACLTTITGPENTCFSPEINARRLIRSSGMIKKKFSQTNNGLNYYTNNKQYLISRNRTIEQNNFSFFRQGDSTVIAGTPQSRNNIYTPQGLSNCRLVSIMSHLNNNTFQYIWINGITYNITIPDGNYDINSLNMAFKNIMIENKHYYINKTTSTKNFLLNLSYNSGSNSQLGINNSQNKGLIEFQLITTQSFPLTEYLYPIGNNWSSSITQQIPQFVFLNNLLPQLLGISTNIILPLLNTYTTSQNILANYTGSLVPPFVALYYKPNNPSFAQQGGVSSSTLTAKMKFDTINNMGYNNREALGSAFANEMAYSVQSGYNSNTIKNKLGFPNKLIPTILANGNLVKCFPKRFSNM